MREEPDDRGSCHLARQSSPFKTLLSGSVIYGLGTVLVQTVTILLMPLLTTHLSAREYGVIALLNFAGLFLFAIFSLGLSSAVGICYFEKATPEWRSRVISTSFGLMLSSSVVLVSLAYLLLPLWSRWLLTSEGFELASLYAAIAAALTTMIIPFDNKIRLDDRPLCFIAASFVSTLAIGSLTLWFVISLQRGVQGYFEALVLGRVLSFAAFYVFSGGFVHLKWSKEVALKLLKLGIPLMPQFLILYFMQYGNIELIKQWGSLDSAGLYSAGLTIGLASNVVVSSVSNAWAPFFLSYTSKQAEAAEIFGRITKYYIFGGGCFSLSFYYFAQPLMLLLASPEYYQAFMVVGPVASSMYMLGLFNMLLPPVYFAKQVSKITHCAFGAGAMLVLLGYFSIPTFGIYGAAWSCFMSYGFHTLLLFFLNSRRCSSLRIVYEKRPILIFLVFYLASCFLISIMQWYVWQVRLLLFIVHFVALTFITYKQLNLFERARVSELFSRVLMWRYRRVS